MDERIVRFRVGVMVLATLLITAILVLLFGELPSLLRGSYVIHIRFNDAPGIGESTPVRKSGILIGRVTHVDFDDKGKVIVTAAIDANRKLQRHEVPRIRSSLLGDAEVQFVPVERQVGPPGANPNQPQGVIKPGETIEGAVVSDPLQVLRNLEPQLNEMMKSVTRTSDEFGRLTSHLNNLLDANDEQMNRVLAKTERALDSIYRAANSTESLVGDPELRANLKQTAAELPAVLEDTRQVLAGFSQTLQLADRNLQNLEGFTRPLGQRGDELFAKLDRSAGKLEIVLDRMVIFGDTLTNREGSLGRLVNDPQLYENLNSAAQNIECLTRELRPIVNDVRVFTDKVARDPGRLGVRGVFQQSSGIK